MSDLIYLAIALAFFGIAIAYVNGCERLRGGPHDWRNLADWSHGTAPRLPALRASRSGEIL